MIPMLCVSEPLFFSTSTSQVTFSPNYLDTNLLAFSGKDNSRCLIICLLQLVMLPAAALESPLIRNIVRISNANLFSKYRTQGMYCICFPLQLHTCCSHQSVSQAHSYFVQLADSIWSHLSFEGQTFLLETCPKSTFHASTSQELHTYLHFLQVCSQWKFWINCQ